MKKIHSILSLLAIAIASGFFFSSCDDEEDQMLYVCGFSQVSASNEEMADEMKLIEDTFFEFLGITGSPFAMEGTSEVCDRQVATNCQSAEAALSDRSWTNSYTYTVTNISTNRQVYSYTFE